MDCSWGWDWDCGWGICGAEDDLCPCSRLPMAPNRWWDFPFVNPPLAGCRPGPWNGVALVPLLALFSRSSIFFLNCLASFSSTNENPAKQSSSSKE